MVPAAGRPDTTRYKRHYHVRRFAVAHVGRDPLTITLDDLVTWLAGQNWSKET